MITFVALFMCCDLAAGVEQCFLLCFERLDQVFKVEDASFCGCMNVVDRNATGVLPQFAGRLEKDTCKRSGGRVIRPNDVRCTGCDKFSEG